MENLRFVNGIGNLVVSEIAVLGELLERIETKTTTDEYLDVMEDFYRDSKKFLKIHSENCENEKYLMVPREIEKKVDYILNNMPYFKEIEKYVRGKIDKEELEQKFVKFRKNGYTFDFRF